MRSQLLESSLVGRTQAVLFFHHHILWLMMRKETSWKPGTSKGSAPLKHGTAIPLPRAPGKPE